MRASEEAEQAVLGALMVSGSAMREIDITPEDFAYEAHQEIFSAIAAALRDSGSADLVTVSHAMQSRGSLEAAGGVSYLSELSRNTPSAANIGSYAGIVKQRAQQRRAIEIAESLQLAVEHEGMGAVDHAISRLMALGQSSRQYEFTIKEALRSACDTLAAAREGEETGIPTGLVDLDNALGGLNPTDLIVVAARPAIGKTAFMLNLALNAQRHVGIISGEQPHEQLGMRSLAREARVPLHRMRTGRMSAEDWQKLSPAVETLTNADNIRIMDRSGPTITEVIRQARKWAHNFGLEALYVDYIQKLRGSDNRQNKREQVEEIVAGLKDLARELEIPVVALAQVNRDCEHRQDKRPGLSDLKESGAIEQEADSVITLYRDEVYNEDSPYAGIMECNICKNRHGPVGRKDVWWTPEYLLVSSKSDMYGANT